ncbi:MAG TPA: cellulose binding domain-containing protein, partial [Cystobacter sp.]
MRRSSKFVVPGLLSLFTACQGVEPELPASAHSQVSELAATAAGLTATVTTSSSWDGGFSGVATIKNTTSSPITEWALTLKF